MPSRHGGLLSVPGFCAFCEAPTERTCRVCQRAMCGLHAIEGEWVCIECEARPVEE